MPVVPPKDDEIERYGAYTRLNPNGDEEFVIDKKGEKEETLNELSDSISSLLEYMDFGGQMTAMASGQLPNETAVNVDMPSDKTPQLVSSRGDRVRANGDTLTNMTLSLPQLADSPELSRAKSKINANASRSGGRNKYITGSSGDSIDNCVTHNESFTGTSGIAIAPTQYQVVNTDNKKKPRFPKKSKVSENDMAQSLDDMLLEWEPEFKSGEYSPGEHQMSSPTGNGVAKKEAKKSKVGAYDTNTSKVGKEFPGKHNDTVAMCDVDEDGVENEPQGSHESTHGEPEDGRQTAVGHNWPDKPKHGGSGVAEPFEGSRWSDGGTLKGSGPDEGSNEGQSEGREKLEWSPDRIGRLLGEETNIQNLFDSYARSSDTVHVEGFQELCEAHGLNVILNEKSLLNLMDVNREYMFNEYVDANGPYWVANPIREGEFCKTCFKDPCECDSDDDDNDDDCDSECTENVRRGRKPLNENLNEFVGPGLSDTESPLASGRPSPIGRDRPTAGIDAYGAEDIGVGRGAGFGAGADSNGSCDSCGYSGPEEECPECGTLMSTSDENIGGLGGDSLGGAEDNLGGVGLGGDSLGGAEDSLGGADLDGAGLGGDTMGDFDGADDTIDMNRGMVSSPKLAESLQRFMTSARSLIENGDKSNRSEIAEALNHSWSRYAGNINPRSTPSKVQNTLHKMMNAFPGFLRENASVGMNKATGSSINPGNVKKSPDLPDQPSEMKEIGQKGKLSARNLKNSLDGTPIISGTAKGLTGTGSINSESAIAKNRNALKENVGKLSKRIKKSIEESSKSLRGGKFTVEFNTVVSENGCKNSTPTRTQLVEAVADLEEILQLHPIGDVKFETRFKNLGGTVVLKADAPLVTITPRHAIVSEGSVLFRFQRNAELLAENLVARGATCRISQHNWGSAVKRLK